MEIQAQARLSAGPKWLDENIPNQKAAGRKFLQELGLKTNAKPVTSYGFDYQYKYDVNKDAGELVKEMKGAKWVHNPQKRRYEAKFPKGIIQVIELAPGMSEILIIDSGRKARSKNVWSSTAY